MDNTDPIERLHGRRRGHRLRTGRQVLMDELLPRLAVDMPAQPPLSDEPWDQRLFGRAMDELWLEIGFGGGEHLAAQAQSHPGIGIVGCEPFINGVASLLNHVATQQLDNVRIHHGDARKLMDRLPDASIGRAFLLFPDPWPKKRHAERRFVSPVNLDRLARLLKDGAELRIASDDMGYIRWTLEQVPVHPCFEWLARRPGDWRRRPEDWPPTRYEAKAIAQQRVPIFLGFRRLPRAISA